MTGTKTNYAGHVAGSPLTTSSTADEEPLLIAKLESLSAASTGLSSVCASLSPLDALSQSGAAAIVMSQMKNQPRSRRVTARATNHGASIPARFYEPIANRSTGEFTRRRGDMNLTPSCLHKIIIDGRPLAFRSVLLRCLRRVDGTRAPGGILRHRDSDSY